MRTRRESRFEPNGRRVSGSLNRAFAWRDNSRCAATAENLRLLTMPRRVVSSNNRWATRIGLIRATAAEQHPGWGLTFSSRAACDRAS